MSYHARTKPFPNQGEIIRAIAVAFDIKSDAKALDHNARQGDIDYRSRDSLIRRTIFAPLKDAMGDRLANKAKSAVTKMLDMYIETVKTTSLAGVSTQNSSELLTQYFFAPFASELVVELLGGMDSPSPVCLFDENTPALGVAFDWLEQTSSNWKATYADLSKQQKDQIRRWCKDEDLATKDSIMRLKESFQGSTQQKSDLMTLLMVSRALDYVRKVEGGGLFLESMRNALWIKTPDGLLAKEVNEAKKDVKDEADRSLQELACELERALSPSIPKELSDQKTTRELLDHCQVLLEKSQHRYELYRINWYEARWHLFNGDTESALESYKQAFDQSLYLAGPDQLKIMSEYQALAAALAKRPILTRIKHQQIAFAMQLPPMPSGEESINNRRSRSTDNIVEDWEVDYWASYLEKILPRNAWFPGHAEPKLKTVPKCGPIIDDGRKPLKLDLRNPDRKIKVGSNFSKRGPQLVWFTHENDAESVRKLLQAGAKVDVFSDAGDSPLLLSIEELSANNTGNSMRDECYNLLSAMPHKPTTINLRSTKKRLTCLTSAIDTGRPDIVRLLLDKGAEVDLRGSTSNETALNIVMKRISFLRNPEKTIREQVKLSERMTPEGLESIRRHGNGMLGMTLDDTHRSLQSQKSDPLGREAKILCYTKYFKKLSATLKLNNMTEIARALLEAGANPNADHTTPVQGFTPLMQAAEIDDIELFEAMLAKGGNPFQSYPAPRFGMVDCFGIAKGFGSMKVLAALRKR